MSANSSNIGSINATTSGAATSNAAASPAGFSGLGQTFTVGFTAAKRGVQTRFRILGRRAFPTPGKVQPKIGERWVVRVVAENPRSTVYFVRCLRLASSSAAEVPQDPAEQALRELAWIIARGQWRVARDERQQIVLRNRQLFYARRMKALKKPGLETNAGNVANVREHLDLVSRIRKEFKEKLSKTRAELAAAEAKRLLSPDIAAIDAQVRRNMEFIISDNRVVYSMETGEAHEFEL
jgi:hypothetical protein